MTKQSIIIACLEMLICTHMKTCTGWPNELTSRCKVDSSCQKAASCMQPNQSKQQMRSIYVDLCWEAKQLASELEMQVMASQVHARSG